MTNPRQVAFIALKEAYAGVALDYCISTVPL
jgi:hypothetical protein